MRLLDPRFKYRPADSTDIRDTWKKHGFKPTTDAERKARQVRDEREAKKATQDEPLAKRKLRVFSGAKR